MTAGKMLAFKGAAEIVKALDAFEIAAKEGIADALNSVAGKVVTDAKRSIRNHTGHLTSAIHVKYKATPDKLLALPAIDRKKAPHAWLVEFGPYARPYFRPALRKNLGRVVPEIKSKVRP